MKRVQLDEIDLDQAGTYPVAGRRPAAMQRRRCRQRPRHWHNGG
ncbi:MAG TPA: hypothetical protein VIY28_06610 [Pseudonocardiaceae bacterium]